ncbi:two-component system response regulator KdpE [soil metagenome]
MTAPILAAAIPQPPGHSALVLVIEDEEPIRRFLRATLEASGFRVKESGTAHDGVLQAVTQRPDLILLDLGLPDGDGLIVTQKVRTESTVPIIVLSARGKERDKVAALDAGADDYLTKPFAVNELMARIRVALRRSAFSGPRAETAEAALYSATADGRTLHVDLVKRIVTITDERGPREARLTPMEFKLLALLVKHAGRVLTHQFILKEIWGPQHQSDVQYLRVYAGELRKKLEAQPAQPRFLITEPGVGYRLFEST